MQAIREKRRQAAHQSLQTRRFRLDNRQKGATVAARKILVIIENLCRCLNRSNSIQKFLLCIFILAQFRSSGDAFSLRYAFS
ncbi:MAG: hypothetical protein HWD60_07495 [Defluviicoccus sp.]|nr:MAG: hypothetical protein HWD60_07495 [Defluviicoccus sp.]